jgi:predicted small secreted protein
MAAPAFFRSIIMRKATSFAILAAALLVGACNTVEGVGKDVKSAGDTVAKTADSAK